MLSSHTDVLIVGAGPTGLALAAALQQAGVSHLLIDALEEGQNSSRAAVIHAHTIEMLGSIEVVEPLVSEGMLVSSFTIRDRDRPLLSVAFEGLPSTFRNILMIPQSTTEALLEERLGALGGEVQRGVAAIRAVADSHGAAVRVRTGDSERVIRARYVVGADGMHSIVRESAGIGFAGEPYGESFVLADVRMEWPLGIDEVSLFFSPAGLVVVAPLPGGSFRIVATMDDAPAEPGIEHVQALLDARGPKAAHARVTEILWSSRFRVHHRLADSYRKGPFLLMGDAAHVHSPAGGQGMNTGLVDAIVLGEALIRVVRGGEPESVLDSYADIRRPAARKVLALAGRLTDVATVRSRPARIVRNAVLRLLDHLPAFKRRLMLGLSGLDRRRFTCLAPKSIAGDAIREPTPRRLPPRRSSERHAALG